MQTLKIAFYTEAGKQRGMGHLIRCYAIYEECKRCGMEGTFFLDSDIDFKDKFHDIQPFTWGDFQLKERYDIVVIDSYEASLEYYCHVSETVHVPVFIDDYGRLAYPRGVIINFAPDAEELFFATKNSKNSYLLGVDYIPLRKEILSTIPKQEQQLFIMLGGSDVFNLSPTILDSMQDFPIKKVIVVNNEIAAESLHSYPNVTVLCKPSDEELISEMAKSSIAISTASMTVYELAYFQIPTIIFAVNEDQKIGSTQLLKHHLASYLIDVTDQHWTRNLQTCLSALSAIHVPSIVDGHGTQRIVEFLKKRAEK